MTKIYLQIKKIIFQDKPLPSYTILEAPPEEMVKGIVGLEPGECVSVYRCVLPEGKAEMHAYVYRVSNVEGQVQEELTEHLIFEHYT